jgi:hypothetical protein
MLILDRLAPRSQHTEARGGVLRAKTMVWLARKKCCWLFRLCVQRAPIECGTPRRNHWGSLGPS